MYFQEILQDHNLTSYGYLCLKSEEELFKDFCETDRKTAVEDNRDFPPLNKEQLLSSLFRFKPFRQMESAHSRIIRINASA